MFKKTLFAVACAAVLTAGCSQQNQQQNQENQQQNQPADSTSAAQSSAVISGQGLELTSLAGPVQLQQRPEKIAVMDGNALATIVALGAEDKVVAVPKSTPLPQALSEFNDERYINAGTAKEANLERVAASQPELILVNTRMQNMIEPFKKIAPTYYIDIDYNDHFATFKQQTINIAQIVNKSAEAETKLTKLEQDISSLKAKTGDKTALIVMVNNNKLAAYGPGSRFGVIHDLYGFKPVDPSIKVGLHGMAISPEFIAQKNPDYIFVIDRGAAISDQKDAAKVALNNDLVKQTKAAQTGHIVYLDSPTWYLMNDSLLGMQAMVDEVTQAVSDSQ